MDVGMLGINYRSSGLDFRESFAKTAQRLLEREDAPFVVLSTCNRTEVYFSGEDLGEIHSKLLLELEWDRSFEGKLYSYFGKGCFVHLARVTTGVDSALFGEAEIQGQVKKAYETASALKKLPSALHYLFQKSLKVGKEIRTKFSLPKGMVSLESILWDLICCFFPEKEDFSVLLVGYSEINRKIASFFERKGRGRFRYASQSSAVEGGLPWQEIRRWTEYEVLIGGAKSSGYLVQAGQIPLRQELLKTRLAIDLSLPRSLDPLIGKSPLISLFNIEEIGAFVDQKQQISFLEQKEIQQEIDRSVAWQGALYDKKRLFLCT